MWFRYGKGKNGTDDWEVMVGENAARALEHSEFVGQGKPKVGRPIKSKPPTDADWNRTAVGRVVASGIDSRKAGLLGEHQEGTDVFESSEPGCTEGGSVESMAASRKVTAAMAIFRSHEGQYETTFDILGVGFDEASAAKDAESRGHSLEGDERYGFIDRNVVEYLERGEWTDLPLVYWEGVLTPESVVDQRMVCPYEPGCTEGGSAEGLGARPRQGGVMVPGVCSGEIEAIMRMGRFRLEVVENDGSNGYNMVNWEYLITDDNGNLWFDGGYHSPEHAEIEGKKRMRDLSRMFGP